jgi:hypothetical protein
MAHRRCVSGSERLVERDSRACPRLVDGGVPGVGVARATPCPKLRDRESSADQPRSSSLTIRACPASVGLAYSDSVCRGSAWPTRAAMSTIEAPSALAYGPDLLICDEITAALDVSVQAAVIDLLKSLQRDLDLAILLITHDLAVAASTASRVVVLQHGRIREQGPVRRVIGEPVDAYTRNLLASVPRLRDGRRGAAHENAKGIDDRDLVV